MRTILRRLAIVFGILVLVVVLGFYFLAYYPATGWPFYKQRLTQTPVTPAWALECWVWEDDTNTAASTLELVNGYLEHDFPVRTVLIDSPWSTRYNDFQVDEARFPNPAEFFGDLEKRGIRVVLWMTSMVNVTGGDTANSGADFYNEAKAKGYLMDNGAIMKWWKGKGGTVDYTNPAAMLWWHGLQQQVFNWGIDGWKLDGSAELCFGQWGPIKLPFARCADGVITTRQYMDHYYRDEYFYGLTQNPDFVVMSRSIDSVLPFLHQWGVAPLDASPLNWVGDNNHKWESDKHLWQDDNKGLDRALECILRSADLGYCMVGSDIAGYHGSAEIPAELYIRWAQFSAFGGFFLNGGHGERRIWLRSPEEQEVIRTYSWWHQELVPYLYTHGVICHEGGKPLMRRAGGPGSGSYEYFLGDDFFVSPIRRPAVPHTVNLPAGKWRWINDDTTVLEGPQTITKAFANSEFPAYIRDGAVVPMAVSRPYTGIGDKDSEGFVTWNIYPSGTSKFTVQNTDKTGPTTCTVVAGKPATITLEGVAKKHILRVLSDAKPVSVKRGETVLTEGADWRWDEAKKRLIIRCEQELSPAYTIAF